MGTYMASYSNSEWKCSAMHMHIVIVDVKVTWSDTKGEGSGNPITHHTNAYFKLKTNM